MSITSTKLKQVNTMEPKDNQLQIILNEQGVDRDNAAAIVKAFGGPFDEAGKILATYQDIKVTDESQTDLMQQAREKRLALKKARTTVENNRKALKEDIVKQGRAIDSIARYVRETIEPAEEYLELQEKFAEIRAAERKAAIKAERIEKLSAYTDNLSIYNFDTMTDEAFKALHTELKQTHEAKLAREKSEREEAERLERERLAEQERIRKDNERLRAEAAAKEAEREKERKAEADRLAKLQAEQEKKLAAERAKAEVERKQREAVEAQQRAEKERLAREKAQAEEAERQALLAPDKEKLLAFSVALETIRTQKLPAVRTKQAQDIVNDIDQMLVKMRGYITTKAKSL